MQLCQIALGGNLGNVSRTFDEALAQLDALAGIRVTQASSFYRTPPVGESAGHDFLNAAAELETTLEPGELLERLHSVEHALGRQRTGHWTPRSLDLDLLFCGQRVLWTPTLRVPHPACWYRRFVLEPLAEICPDVRHPLRRLSVKQLYERLLVRPLLVALAGSLWDRREQFQASVDPLHEHVRFEQWIPRTTASESQTETVPAIVFWPSELLPGSPSTHGDASPSSDDPACAPPGLPIEAQLRVPDDPSAVATFVRDVLRSAAGR